MVHFISSHSTPLHPHCFCTSRQWMSDENASWHCFLVAPRKYCKWGCQWYIPKPRKERLIYSRCLWKKKKVWPLICFSPWYRSQKLTQFPSLLLSCGIVYWLCIFPCADIYHCNWGKSIGFLWGCSVFQIVLGTLFPLVEPVALKINVLA